MHPVEHASKQEREVIFLEGIIEKHDVYSQARAKGTMQDVVERMRENIQVDSRQTGSRGELTSFEVSFQGKEPAKVRDVTSSLVDLFIHYNFKLRQERGGRYLRFFFIDPAIIE